MRLEVADDLVEQVAGAVAVERRDRDRIAEPELVQLECERVVLRVVDLVREHEHRLVRLAQDLRDLLVARRHADARVDEEEDEIGLGDGFLRLLRDRARDRRWVGHVDAAGVDEHEALPCPLADELLPVARHARHFVDNRVTRFGQPIDERRFADVREADDRHRAEERRGRRRGQVSRVCLFSVGHDGSVTAAASARPGGTASRGRPASCRSRSQLQRRWSSSSIC